MNFEVGGRRVLTTLLVLTWLVCGGVALLACLSTEPVGMPYSSSDWKFVNLAVGAGAIAVGHTFLSVFKDHSKQTGAVPGAKDFWLCVWGFVAVGLGWFVSLACLLATAGGWLPPGQTHAPGHFFWLFWTAVGIFVIWGIPVAVVAFFAWLVDGFRSKA